DEGRLEAQAARELADLRAAAVDDHDPQADRVEQGDVGGEGVVGAAAVVGVGDRVAAVLDDHGVPGPAGDPGQRLPEDARLVLGGAHPVGERRRDGHVVYSELI